MSIAKVSEITAASKKSFEDAIVQGIARASKTIENIQGAWIQQQTIQVQNGTITEFRVNMKITFVLRDK